MSDSELLEFLLIHSETNEETLYQLLSKFGNINEIADLSPDILKSQFGASVGTAVLLKLIPSICHKKSANSDDNNKERITSTAEAKNYFENLFSGCASEYLVAAAVNNNMWISVHPFKTSGSRSEVSAQCRDIIRFAVTSGTNMVIIAHNHPDGKPNPSESDIIATRRIIDALSPLDIKVLDHIIVGRDSSLSLRETTKLIRFDEVPKYSVSL